ncbi:Beta-galactosidase [Thalictrum thalictroides]|uniref:Beta-galactosidase n=1 Tax=Thalictrum thalictroides TaxID=46969 RepID=A0A7J6VLF2_THATH|nr:Beta-galactosidase [Thalictrum thalictroides]
MKIPLVLTLLSLWIIMVVSHKVDNSSKTITYDGRSLMINGKRDIFFSGSIHYTRLPHQMWPSILDKAKHGGINVIQTYVFWNVHEPVQGQYNFEGDYDLVKFIKLCQEKDMYVNLRVGPFIQAEWNHGGFPYWLREIPDITFRTNNAQFKYYMKKFVKMIISKMKEEKLFAPQGGPIILAQIENEYNNIQRAYKDDGLKYVQWAGNMAVGLKTGIPWVMCKQKDAPDPVINTCNGRNCGDTFTGPNKANKPILWTENWTAQYRVFGDPPSQRSAEDLAFSVARFFSKNGTLANYYMYYGGTNYGRTGASFVTTRYYDEAPLDEYGLQKEPKWGHLKDLHSALRMCKKALLFGTTSVQILGEQLEARLYEKPGTKECAAFLCNNRTRAPATVTFRGQEYFLPADSISILPDCQNVVYNTKTVVSQHNARTFGIPKQANKNLVWQTYKDKIPTIAESPIKSKNPLELMSTTKDTSDYLWYTTSITLTGEDFPFRSDIIPVLQVANLGHAMHAYVNGEYVGFAHGNHMEKSFTFRQPVNLRIGTNHIQLLCMTVGMPDSGAYLEHRLAGVHAVSIQGLNTGTLDLSINGWGHLPGVDGEKQQLYTEEGSKRVEWKTASKQGEPLSWYKTYFDAPDGEAPLALNLSSMSKGLAWVNGRGIGRYWVSYLSPLGRPSQSEYHVPRIYLKPKNNLLVVFDEARGNPKDIKILTVHRDTICSFITEYHPPHIKSWTKNGNTLHSVVDDAKPLARLKCPNHKVITSVEFASFGDPFGSCGHFNLGNCTSASSLKIAEEYCLGKTICEIPIDRAIFDKPNEEPCKDMTKSLAVQVKCSRRK